MAERTDVLIVGGSMVGLAQALFLAQQGIRSILVERHAHISAHPRAQAASPRTMELMRALGLEQKVRAQENPHAQYGDILQVESLTGRELGRFDGPFRHDPNEVSTTGWTLIGQDRFEPLLRAKAEELGADIRFATEMVRYEQDADGVTAVLRDVRSGEENTVRAPYMVAADGFRSTVREGLGIGTHGQGVFGRQMNVIFHAALDEYVADRRFFLCFVSNDKVKGVLGRLDDADRWVLAPSLPPQETHAEYSEEDCVEMVRAAVGVPDLEVAVESSTSWEVAARIADRFRSGRVFLTGDAAHVMPPTGGFGGNMGVQDAHNLAWKLASVLRGQAGAELLDTYEQERVPVAEFTVEQGVIRYLQRSGLDEEVAARHRPETTVLFGHAYRSGAVLPESGGDEGPLVEDPTQPSGRPGTRAPHFQLRAGGADTPLHDLLKGGWWLLAGPDAGLWERAAGQVSRLTGLVFDFHEVGGEEPVEVTEGFLKKYGITTGGAVLVRPDGFVAWRSVEQPADPAVELSAAVQLLLGRSA
ncbi:FAD-dependent monooxygenase (plasmid) [Streptomyces sp. NBC_00111]|uniref:FAD-dependent monooxygenase n=1 Tax=unclassified Streptomyces TaxID=2593676 RepID=UPI002E34DD65|nr:FAD-dependent monooxygenase [Streptomyces sp. NBC_01460]